MAEARVDARGDGSGVAFLWETARRIAPRVTDLGLDKASAAVFALFILAVAAVAMLVPEREWDLAAYVALTIEDQHETPESLHAATWDIVRKHTSEKEFAYLTQVGDYRRAQFADAGNFVSQLPMYRMKPGYIAALKSLAPFLGPVGAVQAVNAASVLILGACLLAWMWRGGFLQGALLLTPLMPLSGFIMTARLGAPDMMVAALTVVGTMLFCSRRWNWASVPVFIAAFLVRPDTILFLFALVLASLLFRWRWLPALAAFVLAASLSVPLADTAGHIGWWPHFWFSTIEMVPNLDGFRPQFSVQAYVTGLVRGLAIAFIEYNWLPVSALLLLATWFILRRQQAIPKEIAIPMLAMVLAVGGKFVVFPMPYDRIYGVYLWLYAAGLLALWKPRLISGTAQTR